MDKHANTKKTKVLMTTCMTKNIIIDLKFNGLLYRYTLKESIVLDFGLRSTVAKYSNMSTVSSNEIRQPVA